MIVWAAVAAVVAGLLVTAYLSDRRDRRRGRTPATDLGRRARAVRAQVRRNRIHGRSRRR